MRSLHPSTITIVPCRILLLLLLLPPPPPLLLLLLLLKLGCTIWYHVNNIFDQTEEVPPTPPSHVTLNSVQGSLRLQASQGAQPWPRSSYLTNLMRE